MPYIFDNIARSQLLLGTDTTQTTIDVLAGDGALFPSPIGSQTFMLAVEDPLTRTVEIMECTSRSGDTLTVVRNREGTLPVAFSPGARVELRLTAGVMDAMLQKSGGTMTGQITLPGGGAGLEAATVNDVDAAETAANAYTDTHEARTDNPHNVTAAQAGAVDLTGDTMTGQLTLPGGGTNSEAITENEAQIKADSAAIAFAIGLG